MTTTAMAATWTLRVLGPRPYEMTLEEVVALARDEAHLPITCVEGWSVGAQWRGIRLLDVVTRAGGAAGSRVTVVSLEKAGYNYSVVYAQQVLHALLATRSQRRAAQPRPRLPAAADLAEPRGCSEHQMAHAGRGRPMSRRRLVIGAAGVLLGLYGVFRRPTPTDRTGTSPYSRCGCCPRWSSTMERPHPSWWPSARLSLTWSRLAPAGISSPDWSPPLSSPWSRCRSSTGRTPNRR